MWSGDEERNFEKVLDYYNRNHPGVILENLGAVDDPKTVRAIVAGAPPDLCTLVDPSAVGTLAANNALEPLDDRFRASGLKESDETPAAIGQGRYRGHLYAIPYLMDCCALLYNKDVFRSAGLDPNRPPRTIEEMEADCRRITKRDAQGHLTRIGLRPIEVGDAVMIAMYGGTFVDENGGRTTITADAPRNTEAVAAYMHLMDTQGGYTAVNEFTSGFGNNAGSFNPLFHGDVGMTISGEWLPYWAYRYSPTTHYDVAPLPYPAKHPELTGTVWLTDNLFCIPSGAHHPREAWDFLAWTQSPEAQRMFASSLNNVPNTRDELHDPTLRAGAPWRHYYGRFLDLAESPTASYFPPMPVATLYQNQIGNAFDSVGYGKKQPADALRAVRVRVQQEMDKYRP